MYCIATEIIKINTCLRVKQIKYSQSVVTWHLAIIYKISLSTKEQKKNYLTIKTLLRKYQRWVEKEETLHEQEGWLFPP